MLTMKRTKRENPTAKAVRIIKEGKDQEGFDIKYISKIKGMYLSIYVIRKHW